MLRAIHAELAFNGELVAYTIKQGEQIAGHNVVFTTYGQLYFSRLSGCIGRRHN